MLGFIKQHLVDYKYGEWHWIVRADGTVNTDDDKAGFWKCPYHNGRMYMELLVVFLLETLKNREPIIK